MYYWVNFINTLCYNVNKTVEFRLLRPTYNFEKILTWLAIFNAILCYAEKVKNLRNYRGLTLERVLQDVYSPEIAERIIANVYKLQILAINQIHNEDEIGRDTDFENIMFNMS